MCKLLSLPTKYYMTNETEPTKLEKLGTWHHPPLVYVVAELAISPHYGMSDHIAELQRELRADFPRTNELAEFAIPPVSFVGGGQMIAPVPAQSPQPAWSLLDQQSTRGVNVSHRAIGLHATAYVDSSDFLARWTKVIQAIADSKLAIFVERAGLRYVNLLVPSQNADLSSYLNTTLLGPAYPTNATVTYRTWASAYLLENVTIQAYAFAPAPPGILLPPTLRNIGLQMPDVFARAQKLVQEGGSIGWIDTDVGRDLRAPFDRDLILEEYKKMHRLVSASFRSFISDKAEMEWK